MELAGEYIALLHRSVNQSAILVVAVTISSSFCLKIVRMYEIYVRLFGQAFGLISLPDSGISGNSIPYAES